MQRISIFIYSNTLDLNRFPLNAQNNVTKFWIQNNEKRKQHKFKFSDHLYVYLNSIAFGSLVQSSASMSSQFAVFETLSICKMRFQCSTKWDTWCQIYMSMLHVTLYMYALSSEKNVNSKFHIMLPYCRDCVYAIRTLGLFCLSVCLYSIRSVLQIKWEYCWLSEGVSMLIWNDRVVV